MKNIPNESELKEVAAQLSAPTGERGKQVAEKMAVSNDNMIRRSIALLDLKAGEYVLEIGPGSATHAAFLMEQAAELDYTGIDISATMVEEANRLNAGLVESGKVVFRQSDAGIIDFPDQSFDKIFTVNTLYFWTDPKAYAKEIYRVLKPGGHFCLAFCTKDFMEQLPFTKWVFRLYDVETAIRLLESAGFDVSQTTIEKDATINNLGEQVIRDIVILSAGR